MTDTPRVDTNGTGSQSKKIAVQLQELGESARTFTPGEETYSALCAYQMTLAADPKLSIEADENYRIGGFHSRVHLESLVTKHAYIEARKYYKRARKKSEFVANQRTIENHPSYDMEAAYDWLLNANQPLLADETYAPLGVTRKEFFEQFRNAQINCAKQKIRLVRELAQTNGNPEAGYAHIHNVVQYHLKKIGVTTIDPALSVQLNSSPEEVWELMQLFTRRWFQESLVRNVTFHPEPLKPLKLKNGALDITRIYANKEISQKNKEIKETKYTPGTKDYISGIMAAEEILRSSPTALMKDPQTFEGTQFTPTTFEMAFDESAQDTVRSLVDSLSRTSGKDDGFRVALGTIERIRGMYDKVRTKDEKDDADTNEDEALLPGEDDWFLDTFKQFNYRSYQHFISEAYITRARGMIQSVLIAGEEGEAKAPNMKPADAYAQLLSGQDYLRKAQMPIYNPALMTSQTGIDYDSLRQSFRATALAAFSQQWDFLFLPGTTTEDKLSAIDTLKAAVKHLSGTIPQEQIIAMASAVDDMHRHFSIRQIEEALAAYQLCGPDADDAHQILMPAFTGLIENGLNLKDTHLQKAFGLSQQEAAQILTRYALLDAAAAWQVACDDDYETELRIKAHKRFKNIYKRLDAKQKAECENLIKGDGPAALPVRELAMNLGKKLAFESATSFQKAVGDPDHELALMVDMREGFKFANRYAVKNDFMFARMIGRSDVPTLSSRAVFKQAIKDLRRKVVRNVRPISEVFQPSTDAIERLRKIFADGPTGAQALANIETIAEALRSDGKSIMSPDIQKAAGIKADDLRKFKDACALQEVWTHIEAAREAEGLKMTRFSDTARHPYYQWTKALMWMEKRSQPILSDQAWSDIGTSRMEFMHGYRDTLIDMRAQLETAIVPTALEQGGPRALIGSLDLLRACYGLLGIEQDERLFNDARIAGMFKFLNRNIYDRVMTMKTKTIDNNDMNISAANDNDVVDASLSSKQKSMQSVVNFGHLVDPEFSEGMNNLRIRGGLHQIVHARIKNLFETWDRHPGDPSRGVKIAKCLDDLRDHMGLDKQGWFKNLLIARGFKDFDTFTEQMAIRRIRQLARRMAITRGRNDVVSRAETMEDLGRLADLSQDGFITDKKKNDLLNDLGWSEDTIHDTYGELAREALPNCAYDAMDPTTSDYVTLARIDHCKHLAEVVGEADVRALGINGKALNTLERKALKREAAEVLIRDGLRLRSGTITPLLANTFDRIASANPRVLSNMRMMTRMGLMQGEATRVRRFTKMSGCYKALQDLRATPEDDKDNMFQSVLSFYGSLSAARVNLTDGAALAPLGFQSVVEFMNFADPKAFEIAKEMSKNLQAADAKRDSDNVMNLGEELKSFLRITKLEKRYGAFGLRKNQTYTARGIDGILKRYNQDPAATSPQQKMAPV